MKIRKTLIMIFILFLMLPVTVSASDGGYSNVDISSMEEFSKKLQQNSDYVPNISFSKIIDTYKRTGSIGITFSDFAKSAGNFLMQEVISNSRLMVELLFIAVLCAVLQNVQNAFSEDSVSKIGYYACYLLMVIIIIKSFVTNFAYFFILFDGSIISTTTISITVVSTDASHAFIPLIIKSPCHHK
jgi:stage III sporulation protein AE